MAEQGRLALVKVGIPTEEKRGRKTPRTFRTEQHARDEFLDALRSGLSVTAASFKANLARRTAYDWRAANPEFAAAWDDAIESGTDSLEDEALRRARDGFDKPVYQAGQLVGTVREYSDALMTLLLKGRRPDKFRERLSQDHSVGELTFRVVGGLPKPDDK